MHLRNQENNLEKNLENDLFLSSKPYRSYIRLIANTPSFACDICHRLDFQPHSTKQLENYVETFICSLCKQKKPSMTTKIYQTLASTGLNKELRYVSNLTSFEARLVSLHIPFAKIRQLTYEGQYGMKGSVINVMADVERIQQILPRFVHEDATVLLVIKRKLQYDHYYMTGVVRPLETMKATRVLLDTSLYKDNNVVMNK